MKSDIKNFILSGLLFGLLLFMANCTDKKKKSEPEVMPVEADNGIGDGAPALDSLLTEPVDTLNQN